MNSPVQCGLIAGFYDAALGHRSWHEVGRDVMQHIGGQALMLSVRHERSRQVEILGCLGPGSDTAPHYAPFAGEEIWVRRCVDRRMFGQAIIGSSVDGEPVSGRGLAHGALFPSATAGTWPLIGAVLPMDDGYHAALGIHRRIDCRDFSTVEAGEMQALLPHLRRALEVRRRLQRAEQASRSFHSVLDRLSLGVILLGATGRPLHANASADAMLRCADGLIRTPDGLRAVLRDDDRHLQALLRALCRVTAGESLRPGGHLRIRRSSGYPAYAAMLAPIAARTPASGPDGPAILLFLSEPGARTVSDLAVLSELFGLTDAEAKVVLALLSGVALPAFARSAAISYNTAKTLLARAMNRTGTRSQVELVLLVTGAFGAMRSMPCREE